jgi:hypothetical protein
MTYHASFVMCSDEFDWDVDATVELPQPKEKDFSGAEALREAGRVRRLEVVAQLWAERSARKAAKTA